MAPVKWNSSRFYQEQFQFLFQILSMVRGSKGGDQRTDLCVMNGEDSDAANWIPAGSLLADVRFSDNFSGVRVLPCIPASTQSI
jgi:hypothetical protein